MRYHSGVVRLSLDLAKIDLQGVIENVKIPVF